MLNQLRAEFRLLYELLADNKSAVAVVARRDIGAIHDNLFNAEPHLVVVGVEVLHELKKYFNDATPAALKEQVEAAIKAVDAVRAARTPPLPPSGPIEATGNVKVPEGAVASPPVAEAALAPAEAGLVPVVPFEAPAPDAPAAV